jgi:hypothetical protein
MRRKPLPRYELWVGEEHKENEIIEIYAEKLGECEDRDDRRGLIYRAYRKSDGRIIIHVYDWSNVPGEGDCASLFEYDSLETAAQRGFRPVLKRMNLI